MQHYYSPVQGGGLLFRRRSQGHLSGASRTMVGRPSGSRRVRRLQLWRTGTIFEGIHVLPAASPGCFVTAHSSGKVDIFSLANGRTRLLWTRKPTTSNPGRSSRGIPRYFNGQEPPGIALTGGLDTRAIMACYKAPPRSLPCYTFGGMFRECPDVQMARRVASLCQQSHEVITVAHLWQRDTPPSPSHEHA